MANSKHTITSQSPTESSGSRMRLGWSTVFTQTFKVYGKRNYIGPSKAVNNQRIPFFQGSISERTIVLNAKAIDLTLCKKLAFQLTAIYVGLYHKPLIIQSLESTKLHYRVLGLITFQCMRRTTFSMCLSYKITMSSQVIERYSLMVYDPPRMYYYYSNN